MKLFNLISFSSLAILTLLAGCKKKSAGEAESSNSVTKGNVSITNVVSGKYKSAVTVSTSGDYITLKSKGVPDHVSPYWTTSSNLYEAQISGQNVNPGIISEQNFAMTIPVNPAEASNKEATSLGPIGMALNGVAIFNDREGGNAPVEAGTLTSFDRAGAHSGPGNLYHYHFTGDFTGNNDSNLIGFLRDGYPIYARKDVDGSYPANLDNNGGHLKATAEFPQGIYHYHASNSAYMNSRFYVLKAGSYYGTKGTFTF